MAKWLFIQIMPLMYIARYFGEHYLKKRLGRLTDETDVQHSWNTALHSTIFLINLLYISITNWVLLLYDCQKVTNTLTVLTHDPRVECYTGDHLAALILSPISLVVYVLGWPCAICVIFYVAKVKF